MSSTGFKPMLAGEAPKDGSIRFPVMASPKLDGIRCIVWQGVAMSRNWKPIPNQHVQKMLAKGFDGLDGELIVGDPGAPDAYRKSMSGIMSQDGAPEFTFWVFDDVITQVRTPFSTRHGNIAKRFDAGMIKYPACLVEHTLIKDQAELDAYEANQLASGLEGVILRDPNGPYKYGRSSTREGWLLKLKRFSDAEAEVIGVQELLSNQNVAGVDAFGHTERSTHKDNMVPQGTLGALKVRGLNGTFKGVEFSIGTGFTAAMRKQFWDQADLVGKVAKYKFFDNGSKEAPRFPVFLGWRDKRDM